MLGYICNLAGYAVPSGDSFVSGIYFILESNNRIVQYYLREGVERFRSDRILNALGESIQDPSSQACCSEASSGYRVVQTTITGAGHQI